MKKFMKKISPMFLINSLALFVAVQSVATTCAWIIHQPEPPKALDKYKKEI